MRTQAAIVPEMMTFSGCLAEILPGAACGEDSVGWLSGSVLAGVFFLLLLCFGVAAGVGVILYSLKRPVGWPELVRQLESRVLPGPVAAAFLGAAVSLYLLISWVYIQLFPDGAAGPHTVLFQALGLYVPVLVLLGFLFRFSGIQGGEIFGIQWKKAPALLGLSALLYAGIFPLIWFCSVLIELGCRWSGYEVPLQEVSQVLLTPAIWPVRTALLFVAIVIAPVFEEIVFRGILLPLAVQRAGFWPGMILTALIFSGIHFHLPSFAPLFLFSIGLGLAYARTRSLLVPVGMHILFNAVSLLGLFLTL